MLQIRPEQFKIDNRVQPIIALGGEILQTLVDIERPRLPDHPQTQGKIERWHQTLKNRILLENYYLPGDLEARSLQSSPLSRELKQYHAGRRLLRPQTNHPAGTRKDQTSHNRKTPLAMPIERRIKSNIR
jgi:hypothetical protein